MQPQPERQSSYNAAVQQQQLLLQQQEAIRKRQLAEKAAAEERQRAEQAAAEQTAAAQRARERQKRAAERVKEVLEALRPGMFALGKKRQLLDAFKVTAKEVREALRPGMFTLGKKRQLLDALKVTAKEVREALRPGMFTLGQKRKLLEALQVTAEVPESLTEEDRRKCEQMLHFLAQTLRSNAKSQAAMSIYKTATGSVIHVADSEGISVFIEVPSGVDPVAVARQLIKELKGGLDTAIGNRDPLTIFNGECRALNFKTILHEKVMLRTHSSSSDGLAARIDALRATAPITEETLAIVDGIPSGAAQTNSVFESAVMADEWSRIAARWKQATENRGFATQPGSREGILDALQSKKHVLILIAHGDSTELRLPSPPPDGSSVFLQDLDAIKEEISKNKPVVYMFCCESASFEGAQNWVSELLRHGATAVYAPQDKIETENTRKLYESFLQKGRAVDPLSATYEAEKESGCRELEMWVA